MTTPDAAILISALALIISAVALGWNIYRDVALKPKVRVTAAKSILANQRGRQSTCLMVSAVNHGPGSVTISMIWFRQWNWRVRWAIRLKMWWLLRGLLKSRKQGVILYDYENPLSDKLPKKLDPGDSVNLPLRWEAEAADGLRTSLDRATSHLGLSDSFGRKHWVSSRDLKKLLEEWKADFPPKQT